MKLVDVGEALKSRARLRPGKAMRARLAGGLVLTVIRTAGYWHLGVSRDGVGPSETEVRVVRRDFGVPESAYETREIDGHGIELAWPVEER